jgi:hypothetical protein
MIMQLFKITPITMLSLKLSPERRWHFCTKYFKLFNFEAGHIAGYLTMLAPLTFM